MGNFELRGLYYRFYSKNCALLMIFPMMCFAKMRKTQADRRLTVPSPLHFLSLHKLPQYPFLHGLDPLQLDRA